MKFWKIFDDEKFLIAIKFAENVVAKVLSLAMIVIILVSVVDLCVILATELLAEPYGFFSSSLLGIFGMFLNVLIALELLENITAYMRKHVVQLELVIVTSLTAVARKIIIFDGKEPGADLTGLAIAILSLSISYWVVRRVNHPTLEE